MGAHLWTTQANATNGFHNADSLSPNCAFSIINVDLSALTFFSFDRARGCPQCARRYRVHSQVSIKTFEGPPTTVGEKG